MKEKSIASLLTAFIIAAGVFLPACVEQPKDLETLISKNSELEEPIREKASAAGMQVDIKGNTVEFTYDLSNLGDISEDELRDEVMLEQLRDSIASSDEYFVNLCKSIEEKTGINGIEIKVNITLGDEVLIAEAFTSAGRAESSGDEDSSEEAESSDQ